MRLRIHNPNDDIERQPVEYGAPAPDVPQILDKLNKSKADLEYWSGAPYWSVEQMIALLLGKDPTVVTWEVIRKYINYNYCKHPLCLRYAKIRNLVLEGLYSDKIQSHDRPSIYIFWAVTNGIRVSKKFQEKVSRHHFKHLALQRLEAEYQESIKLKEKEIADLKLQIVNLEQKLVHSEQLQWTGFDDSQKTYAEELVIAVHAHSAVSQNFEKGSSIKSQITRWLKKNHPQLSREAKERIAKICNWQKAGGAPVTPVVSETF